MKNKLLISAAAVALLATGGLASAQQPEQGQHRAAPHAAPSPKAGGELKRAPSAEMRGTTGQASSSEKIAPRQPMASDKVRTHEKSSAGTTGQATSEERTRGKGEVNKSDMKGKADVKARGDKSDMKSGANETKSSTTTGQGAAGSQGAANLSTEQRTRIRTVIKEKSTVKPVTNVNFSISIGTRVPHSVHLYPLPVQVVEYYPAWRGYEFILVGDQIVVINPRTFEIVAVIEA